VAIPLLFALLIRLKLPNYLLTITLLLAVVVEGGARVAAMEMSVSTTPYSRFIDQVRQHVPAGARVLGLHNYWFGLEDTDYRSFAVPIFWTYTTHQPRPLTFEEALDRIAPEIVLLDPRVRAYLASDEYGGRENGARLRAWLKDHGRSLAGRVDDPTYGLMEIYRVQP
jgi:hypothetical protein